MSAGHRHKGDSAPPGYGSLDALMRAVYGDPDKPDLASEFIAAQREFPHAPVGSQLYRAYLHLTDAYPRLGEWLAAYNVDYDHCDLVAGHISAPEIHTEDGLYFNIVPPGEGDTALVLPVFDLEGKPVDLLAFQPRNPGMWWMALDHGAALGAPNVINPTSYLRSPLQVYVDPLQWLQARCEGVVILEAARGRAVLRHAIGCVAALDLIHARRLAQSLAPDVPRNRIMVPKVAA